MTLQKDQTVRSHDMINRFEAATKQRGAAIINFDDALGDNEDCLTTNLNLGMKRYRTTAENSNDLIGGRAAVENLMGKIRVTHVDCSELS